MVWLNIVSTLTLGNDSKVKKMNQTLRIDISSKALSYCPIAACAEVMADRWSVLILQDIASAIKEPLDQF